MTDNSQAVVWRVEYDPFGNEIGTSIKTVENNLRFPGQYYDQETGLNQNFYRDYDPALGRYIESDLIGLGGGINRFTYVLGNPISKMDPKGLKVYFCKRPAQILFGLVDHHWIKTDTVEAGLGPVDEGVPGENSPSSLFPQVEIQRHPDESLKPGSSCKEMKCVDENCVNSKLIIHTRLGEFNLLTNNCQIFAFNVLAGCRKKDCCDDK
jgi:RHS repeat-associated protein